MGEVYYNSITNKNIRDIFVVLSIKIYEQDLKQATNCLEQLEHKMTIDENKYRLDILYVLMKFKNDILANLISIKKENLEYSLQHQEFRMNVVEVMTKTGLEEIEKLSNPLLSYDIRYDIQKNLKTEQEKLKSIKDNLEYHKKFSDKLAFLLEVEINDPAGTHHHI